MEGKYAPVAVRGSEILGHSVHPDREYAVKLYDFKRPDKFSLEQINTIRAVHDTFSRRLGPVLRAVAPDVDCTAQCTLVDQMTFAEHLDSLAGPGALVPVSVPPLRGQMLLALDNSLTTFLITAACGASVEPQPVRPLTEIEGVILTDVLERFMPALDEAWAPVAAVRSSVVSVETERRMVQLVPPTEMVVACNVEVTLGGVRSSLSFGIPFITIESVIGRLSMEWWFGQVRPGSATVSDAAGRYPVQVELCSDVAPIALCDLQRICSGALVPLEELSRGRATLRAGGVPVAEVEFEDPAAAAPEIAPQASGGMPEGETPAGQATGTRGQDDADAPGSPGARPADAVTIGGASRTLTLRVVNRRETTVGRERSAWAGNGDGQTARGLTAAVDALTRRIDRMHDTILELREDRESLLADVADPALPADSWKSAPEPDRRHHARIAESLSGERAIVTGFVLSGITPSLAAVVLSDLDPDAQPQIVRSIATMANGDRRLHRRVLAHIGRGIQRTIEASTAGGPDVVAEILNNTPRSVEKHVMELLMREDKPLFEEIAGRMFVFEDFVLVGADAIRKVVARISLDELALALKGIQSDVTDHILSALEPEMAREVRSAIETLGTVRRRDVESTQRDIIEELRQLDKSGQVVVARPGEVIE